MDDTATRRQEDWERSLAAWKAKHGKTENHHQVNQRPIHTIPNHESSSGLNKFLIFLAFAIPIAILGYALYINYLPFGYEETYNLEVNSEGIISPLSNEIYLTNSKGKKLLSLSDGIKGQVNLVIEPNVKLEDAVVNVSIDGENVYIATPIDISKKEWKYDWDLSRGISEDFEGSAEYIQEEYCTHFNAYNEQTLSLPNSEDLFESGPMSIYVNWKPSQISQQLGNSQQIVGHFNWEIWQSENSVQFRVGRMNDENGTFYSVSYPVTQDFFNNEHEALAIYSPDENGNGYIELWIDNKFVERTFIGMDTIYQDYSTNDLSLGWSPHNFENNPYFDGCLYGLKITDEAFNEEVKELEMREVNQKIIVPLIGNGNLNYIKATIKQ